MVRDIELMTALPNAERAAIDAALVKLEKARAVYNNCRGVLVEGLLTQSARQFFNDWHRAEKIIRRASAG